MRNQVKRFSEFVNEYYSYGDSAMGANDMDMSACCGSIIDDQGCCTECGEECETSEPPSSSAKDLGAMRSHFGYDESPWANIEEGKRKPKMEMEDDELPVPAKKASRKPKFEEEEEIEILPKGGAKKPMPFMAKKPMPFAPKKPAAKAPTFMKKSDMGAKPGAKGVDLIKGAAKANAMKKDMPGKKGGFM